MWAGKNKLVNDYRFICLLLQLAHSLLQESGSAQLRPLFALAQQDGIWSNTTLSSILSNTIPQTEQGSGSYTQFIARCFHVFRMHYLTFLHSYSLVHEYLELEGPTLLSMRIKHLIKVDSVDKAAALAKMCSEYPGYEGKWNFKQTYLLCICMTKSQEQLMEEVRSISSSILCMN